MDIKCIRLKYNNMHKIKGHIWYDRFKSKIINNIKQLIDTFNYICDNPVKACLVKHAKDYKFCGLYFILKKIFDIVDMGTEVLFLFNQFEK